MTKRAFVRCARLPILLDRHVHVPGWRKYLRVVLTAVGERKAIDVAVTQLRWVLDWRLASKVLSTGWWHNDTHDGSWRCCEA
eukprot:scaffold1808_cov360-Prasinococcus_capsulatus_cf.AAC.11